MQRVLFVIPPQAHLLDLAGPAQMLATVPEMGIAPLPLVYVGAARETPSFQGVGLGPLQPLPGQLRTGDVVIVVGSKQHPDSQEQSANAQIVRWLREVATPALPEIRLASVCTGAFFLGAAGLLDGRSCTTHHSHLTRLQRLCPTARVLAERMLVEDGPLLTSAGVSAGIDLALHLLAQQFGAGIAIRIARDNLVPFRRLEKDPALDAQLQYRNHQHALIHQVQDFLADQPAFDQPYDDLARRFAVSYRHLARLFQQACGVPLKQYHQQLRLGLARQLLRDSRWPVERVAERCGFASPQAFRAAWRQVEPLSPTAWRTAERLVGAVTIPSLPGANRIMSK
ncbi:transcriptional regulator GlxA family with amidase domain [Silvimonas terrae]|uniref:Transcriptional regulator GlxA family with amidase domain n=1 Tax=Silvimonas terrae TaxID=300266 RepID=A0A840RJ96_9NEIS|nr:helix-turn-helix domain-containing protein [Silvimonas terrae]MBB5193385.1 transcriptional regulator GlxA family with amidase domain [Silvimonas terrae]